MQMVFPILGVSSVSHHSDLAGPKEAQDGLVSDTPSPIMSLEMQETSCSWAQIRCSCNLCGPEMGPGSMFGGKAIRLAELHNSQLVSAARKGAGHWVYHVRR